MLGVRGHPPLRRHRVLAGRLLLLLQVGLIVQRLLGRHAVAGRHWSVPRHARLLRHLGVGALLGRLDRVTVDAVLVS